jgi:hypothetical protein
VSMEALVASGGTTRTSAFRSRKGEEGGAGETGEVGQRTCLGVPRRRAGCAFPAHAARYETPRQQTEAFDGQATAIRRPA